MMQTTVMRDSLVGDAWIAEACRQNPVQRVLDEKTGQPNGNILTGPVRLAFTDSILEAKPAMAADPNSRKTHSCTVLFTPYTDLTIFWEEYYKIAAASFANLYNPAMGQYVGMDNPIFDQGLKAVKYAGFTTGCMATNMSSNFRPSVVDTRMNPITDPAKIYPGVWAIVACNAYASGTRSPRKGPRFGLVSIVIIGDDKPLGGGPADPKAQFRGVQVKPPVGVPASAFGQNVQSPPGGSPVGTFYPPGAPMVPAGTPAPYPGVQTAPPTAVPYMPPGVPLARPPLGSGDEDISQFM